MAKGKEADLLELTARAIADMQKNSGQRLAVLEAEVDFLIKNKVRGTNRIEYQLDILLDYSFLDEGKRIFDKLIDYYKTVNPAYAQDYIKIFEEYN